MGVWANLRKFYEAKCKSCLDRGNPPISTAWVEKGSRLALGRKASGCLWTKKIDMSCQCTLAAQKPTLSNLTHSLILWSLRCLPTIILPEDTIRKTLQMTIWQNAKGTQQLQKKGKSSSKQQETYTSQLLALTKDIHKDIPYIQPHCSTGKITQIF